MALIPQERHKQVCLLIGFVALAAIYGWFEYIYTPRSLEVEELTSRLEQIQDRNRRANIVALQGEAELEERLVVYERHVRRLEELIPASEEVPALLNTIAMEARRARVELGSLRPEPASPGEFYTRRSYDMAAVGEYHDVGRFLTSIASLPRIVTPVDLEIQPFSGPPPRPGVENPVVVRFRILTYVLPEAPRTIATQAEESR